MEVKIILGGSNPLAHKTNLLTAPRARKPLKLSSPALPLSPASTLRPLLQSILKEK
jgi:hypothetical protein